MTNVGKELQILTEEVIAYLEKLSYSESRISQYRSAWQRLFSYMEANNLQIYTPSVGEAFIYHLIGENSYDELSRWEKAIIQCTNVLTEFLETEAVKFRRYKKFIDLKGPVGKKMNAYIALTKKH